jgi:hypothetical protein
MPPLLTNYENEKNLGTVVNTFNIFFPATTESLNLYQVGREDAISFAKDTLSVKFTGIKIILTTETELIHSMKSKTLSGTTCKILKAVQL